MKLNATGEYRRWVKVQADLSRTNEKLAAATCVAYNSTVCIRGDQVLEGRIIETIRGFRWVRERWAVEGRAHAAHRRPCKPVL